MIRVLEKAGCQVLYNPEQTCCGQPAYNAGYRDEARAVSSKFLDDFSGTGYIVSAGASCTGFVRNYYSGMFDNSSRHHKAQDTSGRIFELSEFLVRILKCTSTGATLNAKAVYHDSCAALRECRIKEEPRVLLSHVAGLELVPLSDSETCCGFGGTFAVKFEPISIAMAEQKLEHVLATGATHIISTDLSCLMHLQGYINEKNISLKTMHIADVLASGW